MKKILVPTDFSDCAQAAAETAIEIASKANAEIHFLHIFSAPVNWKELRPEQESLYPEIKKQFHNANTALNELVKKAKSQGLESEREMLFNEGRSAIDKEIKEKNYDFVVMGSHGMTADSILMGSYAQKVVRNSEAPVLVVKSDTNLDTINKIVFASDLGEESDEAFEKVQNLAALVGAKLKLLYINTPADFRESDEILNKIEAFLKRNKAEDIDYSYYDALDVQRGILQYVGRTSPSMVAMATHGRKGIVRLLTPSVAEEVVNYSGLPVLSIKVS
ncbi:MAG: universal stress protein [Crocinitomicaceae bacterium]